MRPPTTQQSTTQQSTTTETPTTTTAPATTSRPTTTQRPTTQQPTTTARPTTTVAPTTTGGPNTTVSGNGNQNRRAFTNPDSSLVFGYWSNPNTAVRDVLFNGDYTGAKTKGYPASGTAAWYVVDILDEARAAGMSIDLQLGGSEYYSTASGTYQHSRFLSLIDEFGQDPTVKSAIQAAINDGTISAIMMIDEPAHERWSPGGRGSGNHEHITNAQLDQGAQRVKQYWPNAYTYVRVDAGSLHAYGRGDHTWRYLDGSTFTIAHPRWAKNLYNYNDSNSVQQHYASIDAMVQNQCKIALDAGLDPVPFLQFWYGAEPQVSALWPNGYLPNRSEHKSFGVDVSPIEAELAMRAIKQPRNTSTCAADPNGVVPWSVVNAFRFDRRHNGERFYETTYLDGVDAMMRQMAADPNP